MWYLASTNYAIYVGRQLRLRCPRGTSFDTLGDDKPWSMRTVDAASLIPASLEWGRLCGPVQCTDTRHLPAARCSALSCLSGRWRTNLFQLWIRCSFIFMELDPYWAANMELTWIDQLLTSIFTCWAGGHIVWGDQPCAPVMADQSEISTATAKPIGGRGEGRGPPLSLSRYTDTTQHSGGRGPGSDLWPPSSVGLGPWPGLQCCVWLITMRRFIKKAEKDVWWCEARKWKWLQKWTPLPCFPLLPIFIVAVSVTRVMWCKAIRIRCWLFTLTWQRTKDNHVIISGAGCRGRRKSNNHWTATPPFLHLELVWNKQRIVNILDRIITSYIWPDCCQPTRWPGVLSLMAHSDPHGDHRQEVVTN